MTLAAAPTAGVAPVTDLAGALQSAEGIGARLTLEPVDGTAIANAYQELMDLSRKLGVLARSPAEPAEVCQTLLALRDMLDAHLLAADALSDVDLNDAVVPMLARSAAATRQGLAALWLGRAGQVLNGGAVT